MAQTYSCLFTHRLFQTPSIEISDKNEKYAPFLLLFKTKAEAFKLKSTMEREKRYPTEGFHLGQIVKAELTRQGRSITWLAQQVGCSRENLYKVFRHKWIYTDLLFQISEALDYDFFKLCSDYYQTKKRENNDQKFDNNFPNNWEE